jgi:hypothetical protein
MRNRLWYPPNSFGNHPHWVVQTLRVDETYRTYTEHETELSAIKQRDRMIRNWPTSRLIVEFVPGKPQNT